MLEEPVQDSHERWEDLLIGIPDMKLHAKRIKPEQEKDPNFVSPLRNRIDEIAFAHGYTYPQWYRVLKERSAPQLGTVDLMAAVARTAGLRPLDVVEYAADLGLDRAEDLVDYRLGQAHCVAWISALPADRRATVRAAAIAAVEPIMEPYRPGVVRLVARAH